METNSSFQSNPAFSEPERPDFLKIICILSFVGTGLMILVFAIGSLLLAVDSQALEEVWPEVSKNNPQLENLDGPEFLNQVGWFCVYGLLANALSLIGVIMMWRLERMGFFLYALAELGANFLSLNLDMGGQQPGYGGMIFWMIVDLVFIALYFVNLKHMKGSGKIS